MKSLRRKLPLLLVLAATIHVALDPADAGLLDNPNDQATGLGSGMVSKFGLGMVMARSVPTAPLSKGLKLLKVTPAYIKHTREGDERSANKGYIAQKDSGFVGALSFTHGWGPHWGASFIGGYAKTSGSIDTTTAYTGQNIQTGGDSSDKGWGVAANLVFDPFSNPEGFRLPLLVGLSFSDASGKRLVPFTFQNVPRVGNKGNVEETYKWGGPGFFLGLAPQFNTGPIRWITFAYVLSPFAQADFTYTERDLTTGQVATKSFKSENTGASGGGLEVLYLPWNLSFAYIPPVLSDVDSKEGKKTKIQVFSLTWRKQW